MKVFNRVNGVSGEVQAINYLKKQKYKILEINYKNLIGEIDIIAKDNKSLIFVEVKARETEVFGRPCEAVDFKKQNKLRKVAEGYLKEKHLTDIPCRFDVVEVLGGEINLIKNAF